jgi:hypothetical protein
MSKRYPSGFVSAFYDPLNNPNAPTIGTATGGDASASVTFTAPSNVGGSAITSYGVQSTPDRIQASNTSSPISVTGLTNGTAYTFAVWALNSYGPSAFSAASNSVSPLSPRALYYGGYNTAGTLQDAIDYVTIATTGNSAYFGSLMAATRLNAATGSSSRGLQARGLTGDRNVIEYVTYSSTGNSQDFGDLTVGRYGLTACNDATRSIFAGGDYADINIIDYVTTATTGNATDFGDLTQRCSNGSACSSPTRGVFAHGLAFPGNGTNTISYITTSTAGNSIDFGDLLADKYYTGGCSSSTRGIFMGNETTSNVIEYITIATTGNSVDFGDCSYGGLGKIGASSQTRGLILGGCLGFNNPAGAQNIIEYVTIASTGNTTDFGDLSAQKIFGAASSGANGGLQ